MTLVEKRSLKELYQIAKLIYSESYLYGALETSGSQREKIIQDLEENKGDIRFNTMMLKIISAMFILLTDLILASSFSQFKQIIPFINDYNLNTIIFAMSSSLSILLIIQILYCFIFGMIHLLGFFSGKAFRMLEILPVNQKETKIIGFFAFFKLLDVQLVCMFLGIPVVTAIYTQSISATLVSVVISGFNLFAAVSILFFICRWLSRKIFNIGNISKGRTFLKIIISSLYIASILPLMLVFQMFLEGLGGFFAENIASTDSGTFINMILSFVYPFSLNHMFSLVMIPYEFIPLKLLTTVVIGFALTVIIIAILVKKSGKLLLTITHESEKGSGKQNRKKLRINGPDGLKFKTTTIVRSYIKKDLRLIFRDTTATMFIVMPIILTIINAILNLSDFEEGFFNALEANFLMLMYLAMSVIYIMMALTSTENNSGDLLLTLPIDNEKIYKSKRLFMYSMLIVCGIIPLIVQLILIDIPWTIIVLNNLALIVSGLAGAETIFMIYSRLFGRFRGENTLIKYNPGNKINKAIVIIALEAIAVFIPWLIVNNLFPGIKSNENLPSETIYVLQLGFSILLYIPLFLTAKKYFQAKKLTGNRQNNKITK